MLIQHLAAIYKASDLGQFNLAENMEEDVRFFYRLPIPNAVWEEVKEKQEVGFIEFMGGILSHQ
jgi:hypothetical protein